MVSTTSLMQRSVDFAAVGAAVKKVVATPTTVEWTAKTAKIVADQLPKDSPVRSAAGGYSTAVERLAVVYNTYQAIEQVKAKTYDDAFFSGAKATAGAVQLGGKALGTTMPLPLSGSVSILETAYQGGKSYMKGDLMGAAANASLATSKMALGTAFMLMAEPAGPAASAKAFNYGVTTVDFANSALLAVAQPVADWAVMRWHLY